MSPSERPWISPGRPPWARQAQLSDAPRWLFLVAAVFVLAPARTAGAVAGVFDDLRKDDR